jgi:integrase
MPKASITKRTVDEAKPGPKDYFLWDERLPGFGLKVTPAGHKVYVLQYRIARPGHAERTPPSRWTIGKHGKLTPDQARAEARRLAALVEQGIEPRELEAQKLAEQDEAARRAAERARLESELAFDRVSDLWLDHYANEKSRRPSSVRTARMIVGSYLKPALGNKPLPHIGRTDLQAVIDGIPHRQKATRRNVFAYASVLFGWALKRGLIPANPIVAMEKPEAPAARDRVLSDDEIASVWQATSALGNPFMPFFRLLIITGQRRSEVAGLNWAELSRDEALWTLPAARAKNGAAHLVPLSALAVEELDRLAGGSQWPRAGLVLTTTGKTPVSGISKAKAALDAAAARQRHNAPLPAWRIHDLRRTLATGLQRLGVRFEVTEAVLNHVSGAKGGVAGIYQRHDWKEEKRSALDAWGRHVAAILEPAGTGNVIALTKAMGAA